jgi:hypothetical protein
MLKVYSSVGQTYGFGYYCMAGGSLPFVYENGTLAGIENVFQSGNSDNYVMFLALYNSNNPDRKGSFYDSIFYKGFFEGNIDGLIQVYPSILSSKPDIPVRIFKLKD